MKVLEEPPQTATDPPGVEALMAEAFIKEARRRQQRRRLSIMACVLVLAVVSAVLVSHLTSPAKKTTTRTVTKPTTAVPTCHASQLLAANGPPLGGATDERSFTLTVTNRGHRPCALDGYPWCCSSQRLGQSSTFGRCRTLSTSLLPVRAGCFSALTPRPTCWSPSPAASSVTFREHRWHV